MNPLHWLEQHPNAALTAVVGGSVLLLFFAAWLIHWWVLDWRYWFRPFRGIFAGLRRNLDLPGPDSLPAPRAGEVYADEWEQLDPDQAADQLIAEWHSPDLELTAEDWIARDLADLELLAWDAKQQAARCWEIVHVEFPRLRAELCAA